MFRWVKHFSEQVFFFLLVLLVPTYAPSCSPVWLTIIYSSIWTPPANNHVAGNAAEGAGSVRNDMENFGGGQGSSGFNEDDALIFTAETAAVLIVDDAEATTVALPLLEVRLSRTWFGGRERQG
jgi:hypothetical protein